MSTLGNQRTSVSALLGVTVLDGAGKAFGRVREFAVSPQVDASRVQALVVRRAHAARDAQPALVPIASLSRSGSGALQLLEGPEPLAMQAEDDFLLLDRDLLDQQIIDVHGHKVVRVNDVDLVWEHTDARTQDARPQTPPQLVLRIAEVEVGLRGAMRRLLKGLPNSTVDRFACRVRSSVIPWDFVDLIDRDPSRRVRLKIEQDRLSSMHPSDLADILEELAKKEGQALFSSLDEEVAAEALEEVDVKTQMSLIESLDSERVAGIIEEMDPGAAAELLSELSEERSDAILEEMNEKERHEVEELLEASPDSAAGLMTTEYIALASDATVEDAFAALAAFDGEPEDVTDIFLLDGDRHVHCVAALAQLMLAPRGATLHSVATGHVVTAPLDASNRKVAELFDKYNLRCMPVLDEDQKLVGVVHAEDVIAWLRTRQ